MNQIDVSKLIRKTVDKTYPYIAITNPTQCLPVVVKSLEEGDVKLIVELNGVKKCVTSISLSAFNIDKLMRCCGDVWFVKSEESQNIITNIEQYLDLVL